MNNRTITIQEAIQMSNVRNRFQTINDIDFDSDNSDDTYNPSSDEYISSQETDIYEEEDKASSIYRALYKYVKNKSIATLISSCFMVVFSFFDIIYDMVTKMFYKMYSITLYFKDTSTNIISYSKRMSIIMLYIITVSLAFIGVVSIIFYILYKYGYLSISPINYMIAYK
jgi:hypothetical protein